MPSVAVIIPLMDRSADLRFSLPRLLHQDFEHYTVCLVDNSSIDDFDRVLLECETLGGTNPFGSPTRHQGFHARRASRLVVIRRPRPDVFSFSISRNCGVRSSASDLLLFVNGDTVFDGPHTLGSIVDDFLCSPDVSGDWFAGWRVSCGYPAVTAPGHNWIDSRFRRVFVHGGGSLLLVERQVLQQLGGYCELLEDWGYEDTDLVARLELAGFSRIEMRGVQDAVQDNAEALRMQHFRVKDSNFTWMRNRVISDLIIDRYGAVCTSSGVPGDSEWVTIDGQLVARHEVPQSDWLFKRALPEAVRKMVIRVAEEYGREHLSTHCATSSVVDP
jgi:glycosyltransferase involved in cell wall biosynthesis